MASVVPGRVTRVLLCATHPRQYNGYSLCAVELAKVLATRPDIDLMYYGFQNFYNDANNHRADFPANVPVYDAFQHENPRNAGFGFEEMKGFVAEHKPDVIILYNDLLVVTTFLRKLHEARKEGVGGGFKILAYIDQVYLNQRKEYIQIVNEVADYAMLFTRYWRDIIVPQGLRLPTCYLPHGINDMVHYPVDRALARRFYNLKPDDFIVLNLNRNQPRKRWDICLQAFAEVVATHGQHPIKLLVGTAAQGAWNILELYERELGKRGVPMSEGMKHVIMFDNPQRVPDFDVNVLYNAADVGINTCDGEGFGLCQFQQAACGIPQIVPRVGGFLDFFDDDTAIMVEPKMTYYVDTSRDSVCGEAQLCDYRDFAAGIVRYYEDPALRARHGQAARERILTDYQWEDIGHKLGDICKAVHRGEANLEDIPQRSVRLPASKALRDRLGAPASPLPLPATPETKPVPVTAAPHAANKAKTKSKGKAKGKIEAKVDKDKTLEQLRVQLDALLGSNGSAA